MQKKRNPLPQANPHASFQEVPLSEKSKGTSATKAKVGCAMPGKVAASSNPDISEPAILSMLLRFPFIDYSTTISGVVVHWLLICSCLSTACIYASISDTDPSVCSTASRSLRACFTPRNPNMPAPETESHSGLMFRISRRNDCKRVTSCNSSSRTAI